ELHDRLWSKHVKCIGVDVGGTNTDAVAIDDGVVLTGCKLATTQDVTRGVEKALQQVTSTVGNGNEKPVDGVMIGTTHFVNAVVQRRGLNPVAALRIGLPASASLPPFVGWPADLRQQVSGRVYMVHGGHEYDGRPIVPLDKQAIRQAAREITDVGIQSVAISSIFSPLTAECEQEALAILLDVNPELHVTLSSDLGRVGLLERENVA